LPARTHHAADACINHLRQIDAAKKQWALHNGKSYGDDVEEAEVNRYIMQDSRPKCLQGGTYIYGKVGEKPRCTLSPKPGQALP